MSDAVEEVAGEPAQQDRRLAELFGGFLSLALVSFGGAIPWARRLLVEQRRWVSPPEFTNILSFCQFLPGAPALNIAVVVGSRERGALGAIAAVLGFVGVPLLISIALGSAHALVGEVPWIRGLLAGMSAAAAGMLIAMAVQLARPLVVRRPLPAAAAIAITFAAVAIAALPLGWVLLAVAPLSIAVARLRP